MADGKKGVKCLTCGCKKNKAGSQCCKHCGSSLRKAAVAGEGGGEHRGGEEVAAPKPQPAVAKGKRGGKGTKGQGGAAPLPLADRPALPPGPVATLDPAKAQQLAISFRICEGHYYCADPDLTRKWLANKYIILLYNQVRFNSEGFFEESTIRESRI